MKFLIGFELIKFFKKKKNLLAILVFFIITAVFMWASSGLASEKRQSEIESNAEEIRSIKSAESGGIPADAAAYDSKMLNLLGRKQKALENGDWKQSLKLSIECDKLDVKAIKSGTVTDGETIDEIESGIRRNEILLSRGIQPIYEDCSITGYNFLILLFDNIVPLIAVIFFMLLFGDSVSSETEDGTAKILLSQPVPRSRIYISKLAANTIICVAVFVLIFGLYFAAAGVIGGFGSAAYPMEYYKGNLMLFSGKRLGTGTITAGAMILYILPFFVLFAVCVISIGMMISTLAKTSSASISIQIILCAAIYIFTFRFGFLKEAAPFIPFTYADIPGILKGTVISQLGNSLITYANGIVVLAVYTITCAAVSLKIFKVKDVVC